MRSVSEEAPGCTSQAPRELPETDSVPYISPHARSPIFDHSLLTRSLLPLPMGAFHCPHVCLHHSCLRRSPSPMPRMSIYLLKSYLCFLAPLLKCSHNPFLLRTSQHSHTPTWVTARTLINKGTHPNPVQMCSARR